MEIIRQSRGMAKEYAPLVLDLYENKNGNVKPIKNALENLAKDAAHLKAQKDQREILIGYKSDPYPDDEIELKLTEGAIKILIENNLRFSILTEKAENALQHFDIIKKYKKVRYGTKLTSNENGNRLDPEEPPLLDIIESLKEANKRGIKTWIDLDPSFDPDMASKIVLELYQVVDQWKLNGTKFDIKPESKSDWKKFEKDTGDLLDSLGIESPWTEGVIPTRRGNRNILVIAPHGHPGDDKGTYKLARELADELNCYAVVNEKYRKPQNAGLKKPNVRNWAADLNSWPHIDKFKKLQKQFLEPIKKYKDEILANHNSLLVLHIHGIGDDNRKLVAKLLPEFKNNSEDLHLLIGYGQHRTQNDRKTADVDKLVNPMISELYQVAIKSEIAPTKNIIDKNGIKRWYCGNHKKKLNQKLCDPIDKVQSLQLEFKNGGFRDKSENIEETALKLAKAVRAVWKMDMPAENQNSTVPAKSKPDIDKVYSELMAKVSEGFENTMFKAGEYLIETFYGGDYKNAKKDEKRQSLSSLNQYILKMREKNPDAPKKSWIYNAVNLFIEQETIKAHSKELFHTYGKLPLSHKVLLFPIKDMSTKQRLIEYADKNHPTVIEFKRKKAELKSNGSRKIESSPSLLKIIANPEKIFAKEISKLITPKALKQLPSVTLEKLQTKAKDSVVRIEANIKMEKNHIESYQKLIKAINNTTQQDSEEHSTAQNPQKLI